MKSIGILKHEILFVVSILIYLFAPMAYSYNYCLTCFIIALLDIYFLVKNDLTRYGLLNFNNFFLFSFFFVSFVFPVLVMPIIGMQGIMGAINEKVITKATALCLLGLCSYGLAYSIGVKRNAKFDMMPRLEIKVKKSRLPITIFFLSFLALLSIIVKNLVTVGWVEITEQTYVIEIFEVSYAFCLVNNSAYLKRRTLICFVKENIIPFISVSLVCLMFLIIGDRGLIIICGLTTLVVYWNSVGRIRMTWLLGMFVIGVLLMFALRETRMTDSSLSEGGVGSFIASADEAISGTGILFMFSDFIFICRELYFGFEYSLQNGLFYPEKIFILPFTPFPFFPTILSETFFGVGYDELHTGMRLNQYVLSTTGYTGNFGCHCVIDLFMCWGVFGVLIGFSLLGYFVAKISCRRNNSLLNQMFFVIAFYLSLYMPRDQIHAIIRPLAYAAFFIWLTYGNKLKFNKLI